MSKRIKLGVVASAIVAAVSACSVIADFSDLTGASADASPINVGEAGSADATATGINFIQAQAAEAFDGGVATISPTAPFTAGNALVVGVDFRASDSSTTLGAITDTQGDTFTTAFGPFDGYSSQRFYVAIALNIVGGKSEVLVDIPNETHVEVYLHEYANVAALGLIAGTNGIADASDGMQSPLVVASTGDLIFGYGVTGIAIAGTGFRERSGFNGNVTEDKIAKSTDTFQTTATMTHGSSWTMLVATLKPKK